MALLKRLTKLVGWLGLIASIGGIAQLIIISFGYAAESFVWARNTSFAIAGAYTFWFCVLRKPAEHLQ